VPLHNHGHTSSLSRDSIAVNCADQIMPLDLCHPPRILRLSPYCINIFAFIVFADRTSKYLAFVLPSRMHMPAVIYLLRHPIAFRVVCGGNLSTMRKFWLILFFRLSCAAIHEYSSYGRAAVCVHGRGLGPSAWFRLENRDEDTV
jgi:hypothetical protein